MALIWPAKEDGLDLAGEEGAIQVADSGEIISDFSFDDPGNIHLAQAGDGDVPAEGGGGGVPTGAWWALGGLGAIGIAAAAGGGGGGGGAAPPPNTAPEANPDSDQANEGGNVITGSLRANDEDAETAPQNLTYAAANGQADVPGLDVNSDGSYSFNPNNAAYNSLAQGESQTITYEYTVTDDGANDGNPLSDSSTLTITITGTNDAPVATADTDAATEDGPVVTGSVAGNDDDVDNGATLTFAAAAGQGAVPGLTFNSDGSYSFDPSVSAYQGLSDGETQQVTFNYTVADEFGASSDSTLTITVTGTNDAPVVANDVATATEDDPTISGNLVANDNDVDGDTLTVAPASGQGPVAGLTVNADGSYTFNPSNGAYQSLAQGEEQVVTYDYVASDGNGGSDTGTLTITLTGANDAPTAVADVDAATEDGGLVTGSVAGNDDDVDNGAMLTYAAATGQGPVDGLTFNADGSYSFDPSNAAYQGLAMGETQDVTFDYTVTDENGASDTATLTITVTGANDNPTATDDTATATEGGAIISGNVVTNDTDIDGDAPLTVSPTGNVAAGLNVNADGSYTFDPTVAAYNSLNVGQSQVVTYNYTVADGNGGTDTGVLAITVSGTNDGPTAVADTNTATEDSGQVTGSVANNDSDPDTGAVLTYTPNGTPPAGLTLQTNGNYTFDTNNPAYDDIAAGDTRDVVLNYTVTDENGATDTSTLTITVTGVNDPVVGNDDTNAATEDGAIVTGNVLNNDTDVDGDTLSVTGIGGLPAGLTLNPNGDYSFDPTVAAYQSLSVGQQQVVTYNYTVTDGNGSTDTAGLSITVTGTNDAPVAGAAETYEVLQNESLTIDGSVASDVLLFNDTDVDANDSLSVVLVDDVSNGMLTLNPNGTFSYTPTVGYSGEDTFTYVVRDDSGSPNNESAPVQVTIDVTPVEFRFMENVQDDFTGDQNGEAVDDTFLASNGSLESNDRADGGPVGGMDIVIHRVDDDTSTTSFAGFTFTNIETFEVTSDSGNAEGMIPDPAPDTTTGGDDPMTFPGSNPGAGGMAVTPTTWDLSSSDFIDLLRNTNSTDDVAFLNAAGKSDPAAPNAVVNLQIDAGTNPNADTRLDVRDTDVTGTNDVANVTVSAASNLLDAVDDLILDGALETANITTDGPLDVFIDTLLAGPGGAGSVADLATLNLVAQDSALTIRDFLPQSITTVDGSTSTQDLDFDANDAPMNEGGLSGTTLTGGSGNDTIGGSDQRDTIDSNAGNDTINNEGGNDTITTEAGNDVVNDGSGSSNIETGEGDDLLNLGDDSRGAPSTTGGDTADMGAGNDVVNTGSLDNGTVTANLNDGDRLSGGDGDDTINVFGNNANSDLDDVDEFELVDLQDTEDSYSFFIGSGEAFHQDGTNTTVDGSALDADETLTFDSNDRGAGINIIGGDAADTLVGGNGADTLIGDGDAGSAANDGADLGVANGGNDTLVGDAGDDVFVFDGDELTADDIVDGGAGNDTALLVSDTDDTSGDDAGTATQDDDIDEAFTIGANFGVNAGGGLDNQAGNRDVENVKVTDVNPAINNGTDSDQTANGGDVSVSIAAGFAQSSLNVDATDLDNNEAFRLDGTAQGANEDLVVTSGAGDDSLAFGAGDDSVAGGDGDDFFDFAGGTFNNDDIVDGQGADSMLPGVADGNPGDDLQSLADMPDIDYFGNELRINAGSADGAFANTDNITVLTLASTGSTTLGGNAENADIQLVNVNAGSTGMDTLDASAYNADLTVNDFGGDDVIMTGDGNDVVNLAGDRTLNNGDSDDEVTLNDGDDAVYVEDGELDLGDTIHGGDGAVDTLGEATADGDDSIFLVNSEVDSQVNLNNVTSIENYKVLNDGDDDPATIDADDSLLEFFNGTAGPGDVGSLTNINIQLGNLTDTDDTFTIRIDASQSNDNYQYTANGSATNDTFIKENLGTDNNVFFTGGAQGDRLIINGNDLGQNINFNGDGLGAPSNAIMDPGSLSSTINLIGMGGDDAASADQLGVTGGMVVDDDFNSGGIQTIENLEVLLPIGGASLNATLGEFAADSGLNVIVGGNADDEATLNAQFDNDVLFDLSSGDAAIGGSGNDTFDGGALSQNVVTFLGDAQDFGADPVTGVGDSLTGGQTADDVARVRNSNGTADFTDASGATDRGIETIRVIDANTAGSLTTGDATVIVDTATTDLDDTTTQTITAEELDSNEQFTLDGTAATANLSVTGGDGDDVIATGNGPDADTINGGDGDDVISTGGRDGDADQVQAGDGADFVVAGTGGDEVSVGASDGDTDTVQINPASFMGANIVVSDDYDVADVNGNQSADVLEIYEFEGGVGGDMLQFSPVLFADPNPPVQGDTGATLQAGQSWADAGFPELVVISTTATMAQASTAEGVRQFLDGNDLAEANPPGGGPGNNEHGIFAVTDGTNTYLWLYQDDGDAQASGSDFTLMGVVRDVNNLDESQLTVNYGFTPLDDTVQVLSGSSVDGLAGDDTVFIVPDDGNPTSLTTNSIETIHGTSGDDTVTTTDINGNAEDADTVDFFSNGGSDTVNMSNGQTVITHSNVTFNVGGGIAIDDDATGFGTDPNPETVILADDDTNAPHDITLTGDTVGNVWAGVDSVEGSDGNDTMTWQTRNDITVDAVGGNDDVVNGADGGQAMDLTDTESLEAGNGADDVTADAALVRGDLNEGDDDLLFDEGASGAVINGNLGDDDISVEGDLVGSTLNGNDGMDTFSVSVDGTAAGDVINSDINGGENADTVSVEGDITGNMTDISGGNGADTVDAMNVSSGAEVNGDAGADSIDVGSEVRGNGTAVRGGTEGDMIAVGANVTTGALVDGQAGMDSILVEDGVLSGGTVDGGTEGDSIDVGFVDAGNVLGGAGGDEIESGAVSNGGLVDGEGGTDDIVTGDVSSGATVTGGSDGDTVNTGTVDNAEVLGDQGIDSIDTETVSNGGLVDGGTEGDFITVTGNVESGSTATGGAGDDDVSITGNLDSATVLGEGGSDDLTVGGNVNGGVVDGGAGDDTVSIIGTTDDSDIIGGVGADTVDFGGAVSNTMIEGNNGDDQFNFDSGSDAVISGGQDTDTVNGSDMDDAFDLTEVEVLNAGLGDDTITADGALTNAMLGGGDDYITYEADLTGATVAGEAGDDTLFFQDLNQSTVDGGNNNDVLSVNGKLTDSTLMGGAGADQMTVTGDVDPSAVLGNAGTDTISIGGDVTDASTVDGGTEADIISVNSNVNGGSSVEGGAGADSIDINGNVAGASTVLGEGGTDSIDVDGSVLAGSTVDGGTEDDTIATGAVDGVGTRILGGTGADNIDTDAVSNGALVDGLEGIDDIDVNGDVTGGAIVQGGDQGDNVSITGNVDDSTVRGDNDNGAVAGDGDDTVSIGGNVQNTALVDGNAGADTIDVNGDVTGVGTSVEGDIGTDTISVGGIVNAGAVVDGGADADIISVNAVDGTDTQILGGDGADNIDTDAVSNGALVDGLEGIDDIDINGDVTGGSTVDGGTEADNISVVGMVNDGALVDGGGADDIIATGDVDDAGTQVRGGLDEDSIDVGSVTDGALIQGGEEADAITVSGDVDASRVRGDAGGIGSDGADTVSVTGNVTGGATVEGNAGGDDIDIGMDVTGNMTSVQGNEGTDNISVGGIVNGGAVVDGGTDADTINVNAVDNAGTQILGGDGGDDIDTDAVSNGALVDGGAGGTDDIDVNGDVTGSTVRGGDGLDEISITGNVDASLVRGDDGVAGGDDEDDITIGGNVQNGSTVNGDANNDEVSIIGEVNASTVDGGSGTDTIDVDMGVVAGRVNGNDGIDRITIDGGVSAGSTIEGGDGTDTISIGGEVNGGSSVEAGTASDTISVDADVSGGAMINGGDGDDDIVITGTLTDSSVTAGGAGATDDDDVTVMGAVSGSTLSGGNEVDNFVLQDAVTDSTINGGTGDDVVTITGAATNVSIDGGADMDMVTTNDVADSLDLARVETLDTAGGADDVTSDGALLNAQLGEGDDTLDASGTITGMAIINGDIGADDISVDNLEMMSTILGGDGADEITASGNVTGGSTIDGGGDIDMISVTGTVTGSNILGGAQGDSIALGAVDGGSTVDGGDDVDEISTGAVTDSTVSGGNEDDDIAITGNVSNGDILGGADNGSDGIAITGNVTAESEVNGGGGDDNITVTGQVDDSDILGDNGIDFISIDGAGMAAVLNGSEINGQGQDDTISISGDVNGSTISGGDGADLVTVDGKATGSLIDLGGGADTVNFSGGIDPTEVRGGEGADTISIGGDVYDGSTIDGGTEDDVITIVGNVSDSVEGGGSAPSQVLGGMGDDSISVGGDVINSTIDGGDGDNTLDVGGELINATLLGFAEVPFTEMADTVTADSALQNADMLAGDDQLTYSEAVDATVDGGADTDTVTGSAQGDTLTLTSVESIDGAGGDDDITADGTALNADLGSGSNVITFSEGANATIEGGGNADTINGSSGDDNLTFDALIETVNIGNGGSDDLTVDGNQGDGPITINGFDPADDVITNDFGEGDMVGDDFLQVDASDMMETDVGDDIDVVEIVKGLVPDLNDAGAVDTLISDEIGMLEPGNTLSVIVYDNAGNAGVYELSFDGDTGNGNVDADESSIQHVATLTAVGADNIEDGNVIHGVDNMMV